MTYKIHMGISSDALDAGERVMPFPGETCEGFDPVNGCPRHEIDLG